jgi:hypothetical protein
VTAQLTLFANIVAWAVFVLAILRIIAVVVADMAAYMADPQGAVTPRRAEALARSVVLAFFAAAWICAGRFA